MIEINGKSYKLDIKSKPVEVVEKNGPKEFDCQAVMIQNAGEQICTLNHNWTMRPGGNLMIGSQTDLNSFVDSIHFQFDPAGSGSRRIEIWPLTISLCECKNFC